MIMSRWATIVVETQCKLKKSSTSLLFLPIMALFVAFPFSAVAESQMKLDCTIGYFNKLWKKELEHASGTGYSTTKVAPKDIEWVWPGDDPIRRRIFGFVIGWCKKGNITNDTELQNVMIKLNKLASDHGANAIRYEKSGTEIRFQFLRLQDAFFDLLKRRKQNYLAPAR